MPFVLFSPRIHKGYFTYWLHVVVLNCHHQAHVCSIKPFPAVIANVLGSITARLLVSFISISVPTTGYKAVELRRSPQMVFSAVSYTCSIADMYVYGRYVVRNSYMEKPWECPFNFVQRACSKILTLLKVILMSNANPQTSRQVL